MSVEEWNAIPDIAMPDSHTRDAVAHGAPVDVPAERV